MQTSRAAITSARILPKQLNLSARSVPVTQAQHVHAAKMRSARARKPARLMIPSHRRRRRRHWWWWWRFEWLCKRARSAKRTEPRGTNPLTSFEHYNIFIRAKQSLAHGGRTGSSFVCRFAVPSANFRKRQRAPRHGERTSASAKSFKVFGPPVARATRHTPYQYRNIFEWRTQSIQMVFEIHTFLR